MILDQNYRNIAALTAKVFKLYAQRMFAQSIQVGYEKSKLQGPSQPIQYTRKYEINEPLLSKIAENQLQEDNQQCRNNNVDQSVASNQNTTRQKELVYDLYYGDMVYIVKAEEAILDIEQKLFLGCQMDKIQGRKGMRGSDINIRRYMFKVVHPNQKFGVIQKKKLTLSVGSPICLLNIETNKYIKVCKTDFPKNIIGFKIQLSSTIASQGIFNFVKTKDSFIESSQTIYTSSSFKLVLKENDFYKIDVKQEDKIALIETYSYNMVATYSGCDISFIKQNRTYSNSSLSQQFQTNLSDSQLLNSTPQTPIAAAAQSFAEGNLPNYIIYHLSCPFANLKSNASYYKNYYLRSDNNFYLSTIERKTHSGMKQVTYNMFCQGIGRFNVTIDQFTNSSMQDSEVVLMSPLEHSNCKYDVQSIWQLRKKNLFSDLSVQNQGDVLLVNLATGQQIVFNKNKAKMGFSQQSCKIQINQNKYRFKFAGSNILGCRRSINQDKYHLGFDSNDAFFYLQEVDQRTNCVLTKIRQIYHAIKKIYKAIWLWGLQKEGNKNDVDYSFNRAAKDQYLLRIEISNLNQILESIEKSLLEQEDNSTRFLQFQNIMKKSKILELLIYFCKLFIIKMQPIKKGKKATQQRTVFMIAKRNIEKTLIKILNILKITSRCNKQCSSLIIQFSSLFNSLLTTYPEEVGSLLKESIKNLSILNLNYKGQQLFQWVKLLQKPRQDNIKTLNIYMSIVAEVVVDPFDRGIQPYQIKCVEFLFNLHGNMKMKNFLLSFHATDQQQLIVQFSYLTQQQLIESNPVLKEVSCCKQKAYCSLSLLSTKSKSNPALNYYLVYVYEVIRLYRNLCKDRNKKMSAEMESIGIKQSFIVKVIKSDTINSNLKMAFLSLYLEIYIDQDPFVPFSRHQNRCIRYESIPTQRLNDRTITIFSTSSEANKSTKQLSVFIIRFIEQYIALTINQLQTTKAVTESMCTYFIYIIKFLRASVDFGYFKIDHLIFKIDEIIMLLLLLLDRIIDFKEYTSQVATIVHEMAQFLLLYKKMVVQISLLHVLKAGYVQTQQQFTTMERSQSESLARYIIGSYLNIDRIESKQVEKNKNRNERSTFDIKKELEMSNNSGFRKCEQKIQSFFVNILVSLHHFKNKPFYKNLVNVINENVQINKQIRKEIDSLEIILDKESAKVADELNDNPSTRILNINKLQSQVAKLVNQQEVTPQDRVTLTIEMINLIRKLINKLKQYRSKGKRIANVAQRIIKKNGTFENLRRIFAHPSSEKQLKQIVILIHKFCYFMILDNEELAKDLATDIRHILKVIDSPHLPKLLPLIFMHSSNPEVVYKDLIETMVFKNHIGCGLKTIRSILITVSQPLRKKLQQITISAFVLQSAFKPYFQLHSINDETRQFVKLFILLLPNNQQFWKQAKVIFPQRDLEHKMMESSYDKKSVYLQLLLHVHFLNASPKYKFFCDHTITRIILPQLQNFFPRINEFFDQRLEKHMKLHDEKNDISDVEDRYKKIREIASDWKAVEFKDQKQIYPKQAGSKKKTHITQEQCRNFWEYFYSWNSQRYYFVDFIKEALELGVLKFQMDNENSPLETSNVSESSVRQELIMHKDTGFSQTNKFVTEYPKGFTYQVQNQQHNLSAAKYLKTLPSYWSKHKEQIKPLLQQKQIKDLFEKISCLISTLIIKYELKCDELVRLNQTLAYICILLNRPSIRVQDREFIDRIFKDTQLSKYKSSKPQATFLQKNFYMIASIFYKKVSVRDVFSVFKINQIEFIKYCSDVQTDCKVQNISRRQFVNCMEQLLKMSEFSFVSVTKTAQLNDDELTHYKKMQLLDYIFKTVKINFFSQLYSQLLKIASFKNNYYWFVKKLIDTMTCIKNKTIAEIVKKDNRKELEYDRKLWIIQKWINECRLELNQNLVSNQKLKLEEYATKLRIMIDSKLQNSINSECELQQLFTQFIDVYRIHSQHEFMDRFLLVYFEIIYERKVKINISLNLVEYIMRSLSSKHSSTILSIIKIFFMLSKTKFMGAQIEWDNFKAVVYNELKYFEERMMESKAQTEVQNVLMIYFQKIIEVVEEYKQLPNTNTKQIVDFLGKILKDIVEKLSLNNKYPFLLFNTTIHYLEQIQENLYLVFQCQSLMKYLKNVLQNIPFNAFITPIELREDLRNLALFLSIPQKLRSLKHYNLIQKIILAIGLKHSFLTLVGGYIQWKNLLQDPQQENQIGQQFSVSCSHSMIMIFQIAYEMYHMNYNNFKQSIEPEIKYLQLYSQARLKIDSMTKQIKTQSKLIIEYGDEIVLQAFELFINFNSRIQIIKNQKPVQIFFNKPQISQYFNEDIKDEVLKQIDKHHKQNLYEYVHEISVMVSNSLKIQESLKQFGVGKIIFKYQKQFDRATYFTILILLVTMFILECTDRYQSVVSIRWVMSIIFILKMVFYVAKIFNLLRGFCKFRENWFASLLKELSSYVLVGELIIIILCLFSSFRIQFLTLVFFFETILHKTIRDHIKIITQQYRAFLKFCAFIIVSCIFAAILFAYHDGGVQSPSDYFATALQLINGNQQLNSSGQNVYLKNYGGIFILYLSKYIFCILTYTIMASVISSSVQTKSKYYLYNCLICLKPKDTFAIKGSGAFKKHIIEQHNFWNYIFYFIQLQMKPESLLTMDDIYVKKCIKEKNWLFLRISKFDH